MKIILTFTQGNTKEIDIKEENVLDYLENLSAECPDCTKTIVRRG